MFAAALLMSATLSFRPEAAKAAAKDAPPSVLATVNGVAIKRSAAMDRAWKQYGTAVLNQMADEILVAQAAGALQLKADPKEVDARIQRIQSQFPDAATFKQKLESSGTSLAELRRQIEDQVLRENLVAKVKNISVTDEEVKGYFDANKEKLSTQESVRLRSLTVAGEKEANDFMVALKAGADFAKLASQVSLDQAAKARGGDMGFVSKGMLQPELEKTIFALKPGELAGPIRLPNGFVIFKAEEFKSAKPAVFADIQGDLKQAMVADKLNKAWPGYIQELRDKAKFVTSKSK
jgi:parvulin-like peptidyl-prolyl isomerase